MPHRRHHRCNLRGRDFETGPELEDHVDRSHPKADVRWWMVAADPETDLRFERWPGPEPNDGPATGSGRET